MLSKEYIILIILYKNFYIAALSHKKQRNIYDFGTRSTKLILKKWPIRLDVLLKIEKLEYKKDIITY